MLEGKAEEDTVNLPVQGKGTFYLGRARLDMNLSKEAPLQIKPEYTIYILTEGGADVVISGTDKATGEPSDYNGKYIQSNYDLSLIGNVTDTSIDLSVYHELASASNGAANTLN